MPETAGDLERAVYGIIFVAQLIDRPRLACLFTDPLREMRGHDPYLDQIHTAREHPLDERTNQREMDES
ncbi:hypothetical protein [Halocatena marina]|uniref:hypothetical protein n=1 Tax=Halocatena marina TaxID=2934937 RepID=UPI00200D5AC9|nr:hypothetical protein [Halocatena marina]